MNRPKSLIHLSVCYQEQTDANLAFADVCELYQYICRLEQIRENALKLCNTLYPDMEKIREKLQVD